MSESQFARKVPRIFAQSVRVGDWLFIAGQDSVDVANRTLFRRRSAPQTEQCVRQLEFIVKAAGGTLDNIVKTTVYLMRGRWTDTVFLDAYTEQFRRRLKSPWLPAGLTMDLDAMRTDCVVEIDAVAWLGPSLSWFIARLVSYRTANTLHGQDGGLTRSCLARWSSTPSPVGAGPPTQGGGTR